MKDSVEDGKNGVKNREACIDWWISSRHKSDHISTSLEIGLVHNIYCLLVFHVLSKYSHILSFRAWNNITMPDHILMNSLYTRLYGPAAVKMVPEAQALSNGMETIPTRMQHPQLLCLLAPRWQTHTANFMVSVPPGARQEKTDKNR